MYGFYQRHFLRLLDFTPVELSQLIKLSLDLKNAKKQGREQKYLAGKNIVLIFEKFRKLPRNQALRSLLFFNALLSAAIFCKK